MAVIMEIKHNLSGGASVQFEILNTNKGHFLLLYWDNMREKFIRNADLAKWHGTLNETFTHLQYLIMLLEHGYSIYEE